MLPKPQTLPSAPSERYQQTFHRICLCLAMLFPVLDTSAQNTANPAWDVLRQLSIGQDMRVERKDGKQFSGRLVSSSDMELVLTRKGKTTLVYSAP